MRYYYARINRYGLNLSTDSFGWDIARFPSHKARTEWLEEHRYDQSGNKIAGLVMAKNINKYIRPKAGQMVLWFDINNDGLETAQAVY